MCLFICLFPYLILYLTANRSAVDKRDNETLVRLTLMYIMDFVLLFDIIIRLRMAVVTPNGKLFKGGCAHFDMCNFHSKLIDLDPKSHFAQSFLKFIFHFLY